jgi:nitroreductase
MMNIIDALNWRYAVRRFSKEKLDEHRVEALLTATRLSATSYGLQPYRLVVINERQTREKLLPFAMGQDKVVDCSHLVVLAARTAIDDDMIDQYIESVAQVRDVPLDELQGLTDHMKGVFAGMSQQHRKAWAHQQTYIALGTLLTAAAAMKIDSCPMTGFEPEGFDHILGLADMGLESSVICALGVRHRDDSNAGLPKVRYRHSEMVTVI